MSADFTFAVSLGSGQLYFASCSAPRWRDSWWRNFTSLRKYLILLVLMSGNIADALWGWTPTSSLVAIYGASALEEQFYLLWPLVVRRGRTRTLGGRRFVMIAVSVVARERYAGWPTRPHPWLWTNTLTRLDPLAAGILLGAWGVHRQFSRPRWSEFRLLVAGVATMLIMSA